MPACLSSLCAGRAIAVLSQEENRYRIAYFGGIKDARFAQGGTGDVLELK